MVVEWESDSFEVACGVRMPESSCVSPAKWSVHTAGKSRHEVGKPLLYLWGLVVENVMSLRSYSNTVTPAKLISFQKWEASLSITQWLGVFVRIESICLVRFPVWALLSVPTIGMHSTDKQITPVDLTMVMVTTNASRMFFWRWFYWIRKRLFCVAY